MINKKMSDAINNQIQEELYSSYLYLSMAAHFECVNLPGFANWMKVQEKEEREHAMKFYNYLYERGSSVVLKAIQQPPSKFKKPIDIFRQVLEHEQKITSLIEKLYELAIKEKDYASQVMLQWFIKEQVEEENNDMEIINQLEMVGDAPAMMMMIDKKLGERK